MWGGTAQDNCRRLTIAHDGCIAWAQRHGALPVPTRTLLQILEVLSLSLGSLMQPCSRSSVLSQSGKDEIMLFDVLNDLLMLCLTGCVW
jgi:hypothetical protein